MDFFTTKRNRRLPMLGRKNEWRHWNSLRFEDCKSRYHSQ